MFKKFLALSAVVLLVAACETGPNDGSSAGGAGGMGGGTGSGYAAPGTQEDLVVNVGDRVFFALDRSDLTSEGRATLDRQAQWLKRYPNMSVTVEGHCDERGTREYNLALGERRALTVKNYLIAAGVDSGRVQTISYGKERPAVLGGDESAWSQNRRGVTVVNP
ncbi:MAG: peptidoglycan-associated lipoprotein Pal [Alphaproteobacteria bacterium]|nr:peptidoglycan-associated lipoprotein Pal [Alphaproteobacteria bacterium]